MYRPQITIITNETVRQARDSYGQKTQYQSIPYKSYAELKRNIKHHLEQNLEDTISVSRCRRGQWGEWFEIWKLSGGKPIVTREGWQ